MKIKILLIVFTGLILTANVLNAQTKFGNNKTVINPNSVVEIESTNKGLLLPRMALTATTAAAPLSAHVAGMYVYNTATAGDVTPGAYYNDGTKWVKAAGAAADGDAWGVTGEDLTSAITRDGYTQVGNGFVAGSIRMTGGTATQAGSLNIYKIGSVPIGYIGFDNTNLTYVKQNGGVHRFTNANVELSNQIKIEGGTPGAGKVLTSDATGLATWQTGTVDGDAWAVTGEDVNTGVTRNGFAQVGNGGTVGAVSMQPGTATQSGYVEIFKAGGTRLGYIGFDNTNLTYGKDAGGGVHRFLGANVEFANQIKIEGGTPGAGKVLTSDATGLATWQTPAGGTADGDAWAVTGEDQASNITRTGSVGIGIAADATRKLNVGTDALINALTIGRGGANNVSNTAIGIATLSTNTTGTDNTALGFAALSNGAGTGSSNTAIGSSALNSGATGSRNTVIGSGASSSAALTGSNNIIIGAGASPSFYTANGEITIGSSGFTSTARVYAGSWQFLSDKRTKHNIQDLPVGGLDFVKQLRPVQFIYNSDKIGNSSLGFIAQEVQDVMKKYPSLNTSNMVSEMDSNTGILGLRTEELIPVLTKAIQELNTKNDALQKQAGQDAADIAALKKEIEAIKAMLIKK